MPSPRLLAGTGLGGKGVQKVPRKRPRDPDFIPMEQATVLLMAARVPGYTNRKSCRDRIIEDKTLPCKFTGHRYWVSLSAAQRLIAERSPVTPATMTMMRPTVATAPGQAIEIPESEDQKLIKHFMAKSTHDHITAVAAGLTRTLAYAKRIYDEFSRSKSAEAMRQDAAKIELEARSGTAASQEALPELTCPACERTAAVSRSESDEIVKAVTEGRTSFSYEESAALGNFIQSHKCTECLGWRKDAPIEAMKSALGRAPIHAQESPNAPA